MSKKKLLLIFLILFSLIGCKKDPSINLIGKKYGKILPFENEDYRLEVASENLPASNIRIIHFVSEVTGIVITYEGQIFKTNDGGKTWSLKFQNPTSDQPFKDLLFVNDVTAYVVGGANWCNGTGCTCPGGILVKTTDGGDTWNIIYQMPGAVEFCSIAQNSTGDLFMLKNGISILKSSDDGLNWTSVANLDFEALKISFNNGKGFCIGGDYGYGTATVLRSTDDGNTWFDEIAFPHLWNYELNFIGDTAFCISDYAVVYRSIDNGEDWDSLSLNGTHGLQAFNIISPEKYLLWGGEYLNDYGYGCFIPPANGAIYISKDAGNSWAGTVFEGFSGITCVNYFNQNEGYAVSSNKLLKIKVK